MKIFVDWPVVVCRWWIQMLDSPRQSSKKPSAGQMGCNWVRIRTKRKSNQPKVVLELYILYHKSTYHMDTLIWSVSIVTILHWIFVRKHYFCEGYVMDLDVLEVTPGVLIDSEPITDDSHKNSCASYGGNRKGSRECNQALIKIKFNEII